MKALISTSLPEAISHLRNGDVVAIPTETVYGLAANALNENAVAKIFDAKNRPFFDPLILHVSSIHEIQKYALAIPPVLVQLMNRFAPGPLTVLLKKKAIIPDIVTAGLDTVGIRIPDHPLTLQLLSEIDFPLCAPSANPFGYVSPTSAQHVYDQLQNKIPFILDGGNCSVGLESTIVGMESGEVVIFRLGGISVEEIEKEIGKVTVKVNQNSNPQAPGMLDSHYAPAKKVWQGNVHELAERFRDKKLGLISLSDSYSAIPFLAKKTLSPSRNLNEAACYLFAALRSFDDTEVEVIIAEVFPEVGLGKAINDRLKRASANKF